MPSAPACAAALVSAIEAGDVGAAAAACDPASWAADHGDSPRRLFHKATDPRRGFTVALTGEVQVDDGLAAVQVSLQRGERQLAQLALLCAEDQGESRVMAVSDQPAWAAAFVAGQVPALLQVDALPPHDDSANAVVAVCALAQRAKAGVGDASAMITELLQADEGAAQVVGRLQHLVAAGHRVRVLEGRWLPALGHAVVHAEVLQPDSDVVDDALWIHLEAGPPLKWRAIEGSLRAAALLP